MDREENWQEAFKVGFLKVAEGVELPGLADRAIRDSCTRTHSTTLISL